MRPDTPGDVISPTGGRRGWLLGYSRELPGEGGVSPREPLQPSPPAAAGCGLRLQVPADVHS